MNENPFTKYAFFVLYPHRMVPEEVNENAMVSAEVWRASGLVS